MKIKNQEIEKELLPKEEIPEIMDPKEVLKRKPELGATNQPVPKEAKVPDEATSVMYQLSENLFENNSKPMTYEQAKKFMASKGLNLPKDVYNLILHMNGIPNDVDDSSEEDSVINESGVRTYTNKIIDLYEEGMLDPESLVLDLLKYMSEEDVEDFYKTIIVNYIPWGDEEAESIFRVDEALNNKSFKLVDEQGNQLGEASTKDVISKKSELLEALGKRTSVIKESLSADDLDGLENYIVDYIFDHFSELINDMDATEAETLCNNICQIIKEHIDHIAELRSEEAVEESLTEATDDWKKMNGRQSKEDKELEDELFDRVLSELSPGKDTVVEGPYILNGKRYKDVFVFDDGIGVYAPDEESLSFAKEVADYFGLKCKTMPVAGNKGTKTAWAAKIYIPEDLYDETSEETEKRMGRA